MNITNAVQSIIDRAWAVQNTGSTLPIRNQRFTTYAMSNFRGGIGKSTLAFNLAYELSNAKRLLLMDLCPQGNLSQSIFGSEVLNFSQTIYDALIQVITGAKNLDYEELVARIAPYCHSFVGTEHKKSYMIPGSSELFLFPSILYSQLAQFSQLRGQHGIEASARLLESIKTIIADAAVRAKPEKVLIDTSPFFGGATHLAWCAADALVIPVRVDQHSIEALNLTLTMLGNKDSEYHKFNAQAGRDSAPKVHAIVMTHCGWSRKLKNTPDNSTKFFLTKAVEVAAKFPELFSETNPEDCFYLLDDFHSSGRISGKLRIPLSKLEAGEKYVVDGQRLEVNPAVNRYKRELVNIANAL